MDYLLYDLNYYLIVLPFLLLSFYVSNKLKTKFKFTTSEINLDKPDKLKLGYIFWEPPYYIQCNLKAED